MFMGLALMPEYFKEKVNVFAAMAPPVFIGNITDATTLKEASHWKLIQSVIERLKFYDLIKIPTQWSEGIVELCDLIPNFCDILAKSNFLLPQVDNMDRAKVMLANFPSGSSYRCTVFYGQCVASGGLFRKFDLGSPEANKAKYGQEEPP